MLNIKTYLAALLAVGVLNGCAATPSAEETLVSKGGVRLTTLEIKEAFSNVSEEYVAIDTKGVTGKGTWKANGDFEADWKYKDRGGHVSGTWYAEDDLRCIKYTDKPKDWNELECTTIYQTGDNYTSVSSDGKLHGTHTLTPLL